MPSKRKITPTSIIENPRETPKSVVRYGYAVLFLFGIVAVIANWSAGKLGVYIIVGIVVIGFMLALFAFDRMARSTSPTWQTLGIVLASAALVGLTLAFFGVLSFLFTGHPEALRRFFSEGTKANGLTSPRAVAVTDSSISIVWDTYPDSEATVSASLEEVTGEKSTSVQSKTVPIASGSVEFEGLKPANKYSVMLVVQSHSLESSPNTIVTITNARRLRIDDPLNYSFLYSGSISATTGPNSMNALVESLNDQIDDSYWSYTGQVRNGRLEGKGILRDKKRCQKNWCESTCDVVMQEGDIVAGQCDLDIRDPDVGIKQSLDYLGVTFEGAATYHGGVTGVPLSAPFGTRKPFATIPIGPFMIVYNGDGKLVISNDIPAKRVEISGRWRTGDLDGHAHYISPEVEMDGIFEHGVLKDGYRIEASQSVELSNFVHSETASTSEDRIVYGRTDSDGNISDGYRIGWFDAYANGSPIFFPEKFVKGYSKVLPSPSTQAREECFKENLGLFPSASVAVSSGDWNMSCGYSDSSGSCMVETNPSSISVEASRKHNSPVQLDVMMGVNPGRTSAIKIDNLVLDTGKVGFDLGKKSLFAMMKICDAKSVSNLNDNRSFSAAGFCELAAVAFARLYHCI